MAQSIKPTLIFLSVVALPFLIVGGIAMYQAGALTFKNVAIVLLVAPLIILFLILANIGHWAKFGVLSDQQKQRDAEKYLDGNDT